MTEESQLDILIKVRADLEALKTTQTGLKSIGEGTASMGDHMREANGAVSQFEEGLQKAGDRWEHLGKFLGRNFSLAGSLHEMFYGLGIGSGFQLAEKASEMISEWWHKSAEEAKEFQNYIQKSVQQSHELHDFLFENMLERMLPEQQLTERIRQLEDINKKIAELQRRVADGAQMVAMATAASSPKKGIIDLPSSTGGYTTAQGQQLTWDGKAYSPKQLAEEGVKQSTAAVEEEKPLIQKRATVSTEIWRLKKSLAEAADRRLDATIRAGEENFNKILETQKQKDDQYEQHRKEAEAIMGSVSALEKYRQEVARINALRGVDGGLTNQEADAAIAHLNALRQIDAQKDQERRLSNQISAIEQQRSKVENNELLTRQQKTAQILPLIDQENQLITTRIGLLEQEASASKDPQLVQALESTIDGLKKDLARLQGERTKATSTPTKLQAVQLQLGSQTDPTQHYQNIHAGIAGGFGESMASIGTVGDSAASGLKASFGAAFSSISQGITGLVMGTMTWRQALASIGSTILSTVIESIVKLAMTWILQRTLMASADKAIALANIAALAPVAIATSAVWTTPATLATIATFGGAAAAAPGEMMASIAASHGLALASEGGYFPGDPKQVVGAFHGNEFVLTAEETARLGLDQINAFRQGGLGGVSAMRSSSRPLAESMMANSPQRESVRHHHWYLDPKQWAEASRSHIADIAGDVFRQMARA